MKRLKKIKPTFWETSGNSQPHQSLNFQRKWKLIVVFTSLMALLPVLVVTLVEYKLTRRVIETEMRNTMTGILTPAAASLNSDLKQLNGVQVRADGTGEIAVSEELQAFLLHFLEPYKNSNVGDFFVVADGEKLMTPSLFWGEPGNRIPVMWEDGAPGAGVIETASLDGNTLLAGYASIPNSSLALVMVKSKHRITDAWFSPRLKLVGYLAVSIVLILVSIMGMAAYLVERIHVAEQKRIKALHRAGYSNKMASIGRLASGVAHEINNPLAIINEKTGLMLDLIALEKDASTGAPPNDRLSMLAKDVLKAVKRCGMVTRQLLEYAKNMDPCIEPVDIEKTVRWVMTFFRREAKEQEITFSVETKGEPFPLNCDRGGFQQIIVNLLNNAFAAMERGDALDIFINYKKAKFVEITVSDTGSGIPEADIQNIFEPFYTIKDNPFNTGLGLYVTYGIINEMGGTIFVDSTLGEGTRFKVVLPATRECGAPDGGQVTSGEPELQAIKDRAVNQTDSGMEADHGR